eukprot:snap_masked-scaffold_14-processed-gene-0.25-mRNA-1 protein AED:0.09 eAED:0.09 QI:0/0/0/1/1/1/2/0/246
MEQELKELIAVKNFLENVNSTKNTIELIKVSENEEKMWEEFYMLNRDSFFKDRHYLLKEFGVLNEVLKSGEKVKILEVGSGVANAISPLVENFDNLEATCVDLSETAIRLIREKNDPRIRAFQSDVTKSLPASAVDPKNMELAIKNVLEKIKVNGYIIFRDYAQGDLAEKRFLEKEKTQQISLHQYVRYDGTKSFFFSLSGVERLFVVQCGMKKIFCEYSDRVVKNRSQNKTMKRKFITACFQKVF